MAKKLAVFLVLALAIPAFAATPTGIVSLSYASGACPQPPGQHFDTETLDASGNYTAQDTSLLQNRPIGTYCVVAVYSGDATHSPSTGYTTFIVQSGLVNTTTTVVATPNPMDFGGVVGISGGVQ